LKRTAEEVLALLAEHGGQIYALLARLTLRNDVAEDLMQDLFCKLSRSNGFRRAADPYAYAFRAATNLAFAHRRALRRAPADAPTGGELMEGVAGRNHSPLVDLVRREEFNQILDCIGRLPHAARDVVVLRYLERETYETIADRLGKTPHQVRAICHKGIVRLRQMLADEPARPVRDPEEA